MKNIIETAANAVDGLSTPAKVVLDGGAVTVWIAAFFDYLPDVAAVLSVIWLSLQIFTWVRKEIRERKKNGSD